MIQFGAPLFLAGVPFVIALGLWAIWRTRRHTVQPASSLRLWKDILTELGPTPRRRPIDRWSLLLFLAAILMAIALATPSWTPFSITPIDYPRIDWAVRSTPTVSAFIRLHSDRTTKPATYRLQETVGSQQHDDSLPTADLLTGITLQIPLHAEQQPLTLTLFDGEHPLATQTFTPPTPPAIPFSVLTLTDPGRAPDAALSKLLPLFPGYRKNDPTTPRTLLLLDAARPSLKSLPGSDGSSADTTLVIASSRTPLPGISPKIDGATVSAVPPHFVEESPLTHFLHPTTLATVHVKHFTPATLDSTWHVLLAVGESPWIAVREATPTSPAMIWIASDLEVDTDWPNDPSFVIFFADVQRWWLTHGTAPSPSTGLSADQTLWTPFPATAPLNGSPTAPPPSSPLPIPLTPLFAGVGIAMLLATLLHRWRHLHAI